MTKIKKTVLTGLFLAIAVLLPQYTAHLAGADGGRMFLPMHVPVLLTGLICGSLYGGFVGLTAPMLSSLVTGGMMPPIYPMLPIMCCELFVYGVVGGICSRRLKWNTHLSLITAMVSGRIMYGLVYWGLLLSHTDGSFKALSVWAAILAGIPGIAIQILLIPAIMFAIKKYGHFENEKCPTAKTAKQIIRSGESSCIVVRDGKILHQNSGKGLSPLLTLFESASENLSGAYVLDKVVGKAAAMILVLGGVKKVYGEMMSKSAADYLKSHGIKVAYGEKVGIILNLAGTGMCPLETSVLDIDDPEEGYAKLLETIKTLRSKSVPNMPIPTLRT